MQKQYVYILSNTERSDLVKIGETTKSPRVRAEALSRQTGVIGKWIVEWYMVVPNCKFGETILKNLFEGEHFEKETFKIQLKVAIKQSILELIRVLKVDKPEIFIRDKSLIEKSIQEVTKTINVFEKGLKYAINEKNDIISRSKALETESKIHIEILEFKRNSESKKLLASKELEGIKARQRALEHLLKSSNKEENGIIASIDKFKLEIKILQSLEIDS